MIKSDRWTRRMAQEHDRINPYSEKQVSEGVISCGVSSYADTTCAWPTSSRFLPTSIARSLTRSWGLGT